MKRFFLTLCLLCAAISGFGQKYDLHYNLKKKQTYRNSTTMAIDFMTKVMDNEMTANITSLTTASYLVKNAKKDAYTLDVVYDESQVKVNSPMSPNTAAAQEPLKPLVGKHLTVEMDKYGNILSIKGLDEALESQSAQSRQMLTNSVTASLAQMSFLPDYPVAVGDTWTQKYDLQMPQMPLSCTINARLKAVENGEAIITLSATLAGNTPDELKSKGVTADISGSISGEVRLDLKTGWQKNCEMETVANITMKADKFTAPMSLKMKTVSTGGRK
ncbi:MAG: DUF6263 family protein [Bacteroidales bacterium]|jgi:hypothetical protein|nr:DUF6263 family protein [Bacteroidales bacterium]